MDKMGAKEEGQADQNDNRSQRRRLERKPGKGREPGQRRQGG
jgi:hypothetical protein